MGAFHKFQPRDMVAWLAERGVETKTEDDGRMFPVTDDSATIVDCLTRAAETAGVKVITSMGVRKVERVGASGAGDFWVTLTDNTGVRCERLLLATGEQVVGGAHDRGVVWPYDRAAGALAVYVSYRRCATDRAVRGVGGECGRDGGGHEAEDGRALVDHALGASGPAILKLSAWGARELAEVNYEFC